MKLEQLLLGFKRFNQLFIKPEKSWQAPTPSKILFYNASGLHILKSYLGNYSFETIPARGESVNVLCFLRSMLSLVFWKGKPFEAYINVFVKLVSPKIVITLIDNDVSFYTISKQFPEIKTIFIQSGTRGRLGDVFDCLVKDEKYHVDYMFVHGPAIGRLYKKYISGRIINSGSLLNNHVHVDSKQANGTVLYISQFRENNKCGKPFLVGSNGEVSWNEFYAVEPLVLKFLGKWCANNNKHLRIGAVETSHTGSEREFYDKCLQGFSWEYTPRTDMYSSYKQVDSAEIIVFIDSTLGYESISRGKRTAAFSCRGESINTEAQKFGWPADLPDNGPFWTNDVDEKQFQRVMDYLNIVCDEEWEQTQQQYMKELIEFDPGNTRFVALLDEILSHEKNLSNAEQLIN